MSIDDAGAPELAGPDQLIGVGKGDLDEQRAGGRVHRPVGEHQRPAVRMQRAVGQDHLDERLIVPHARFHAHLPAEAGDFEVVALADAHAEADRIDPRNLRQQRGLPAAHQVAFVDFGLADDAVGRRVDLRVAHVELRRVDRRLARPGRRRARR